MVLKLYMSFNLIQFYIAEWLVLIVKHDFAQLSILFKTNQMKWTDIN